MISEFDYLDSRGGGGLGIWLLRKMSDPEP